MIADTSFLIDIMNGDGDAILKARELGKDGSIIAVTSVTIFELYAGLGFSSKKAEEKDRILNVMEGLTVFSLDEVSGAEAGKIYSTKRKEGLPIEPEDAMMAGICKFRSEALLTRNVKHFRGIEGVTIEQY